MGSEMCIRDRVRCPDCDGHGYFRRDNLVDDPELRRKSCVRCGGVGVIAKSLETPAYVTPQNTAYYAPPTAPTPPLTGYYDPTTNTWIPGTPPPNAYPVS